eukprot:scaffold1954_cov268-Pinguiococcus_pyrenoidosus.AAC.115
MFLASTPGARAHRGADLLVRAACWRPGLARPNELARGRNAKIASTAFVYIFSSNRYGQREARERETAAQWLTRGTPRNLKSTTGSEAIISNYALQT